MSKAQMDRNLRRNAPLLYASYAADPKRPIIFRLMAAWQALRLTLEQKAIDLWCGEPIDSEYA